MVCRTNLASRGCCDSWANCSGEEYAKSSFERACMHQNNKVQQVWVTNLLIGDVYSWLHVGLSLVGVRLTQKQRAAKNRIEK